MMLTNEAYQSNLKAFMEKAQSLVTNNDTRLNNVYRTILTIDSGGKTYDRIVSNQANKDGTIITGGSRGVYCFIRKSDGAILKANGWKGPNIKNPRSWITDNDNGLSGVTPYGATYLK